MVRYSYADFEEQYKEVLKAACGRQACSVLILVALEVDAMATTKMLTQMLRSDHVAHQMRPVQNFDEVVANIKECLTTDIKTVFLVNCGAIYDIPKHFDLEAGGDLRVYILDNHRPLHLKNIHSRHNVVVFDDLMEQEEDDIPSEASDMDSVSNDEDDGSMNSSEEDDFDEEEELDEEEALIQKSKYGEDEEFDEDEEAEEAEEDEEEVVENAEEDGEDEEALDETMDLHAEKEEEAEDAEEGEEEEEEEEDSSPRKRRRQSTNDMDVTMVEGYEGEEDNEEEEGEDDEEGEDMDISRLTTDLNNRRKADNYDAEDDSDEESVLKLKGRRKKERQVDPRKVKRQQILQYYRRAVTYSWPTSLMLLPFAKAQLGGNGHIPLDVMWQGILGLTDQYNRGRIAEDDYDGLCHQLRVELGEHLVSASDRVRYTVDNHTGDVNLAPAANQGTNPENSTTANTTASNNAANAGLGLGLGLAGIAVQGCQYGHIEESSEYRFFLYRHWSLKESMTHSTYIATKFPLHLGTKEGGGLNKLQELLAEIGIPLKQCDENYAFMRPQLREHFKQMVLRNSSIVQKYGLTNPGITFKSFCRFTSYKNPMSANDIVHAATALLELHAGDCYSGPTGSNITGVTTAHEAFHEPYELLGMRNDNLIKKGVIEALNIRKTVVKKAMAMLAPGNNTIHKYHRLYYAYIHNTTGSSSSSSAASSSSSSVAATTNLEHGETPTSTSSTNAPATDVMEVVFGRPYVLSQLGQYIMSVKRTLPRGKGGWTGSQILPLILLSERHDNTYLVMAISPFLSNINSEQDANDIRRLTPLLNFRQFFKLAAKDMMIPFRSNSFDPNVVEVRKEDAQDFLGALDNALKRATPQFFASLANSTMAQ